MKIFLAVGLTIALAHTAFADGLRSDDCQKQRQSGKTCFLDMGVEDVDGQTPTAAGERIVATKPPIGPSLIRLRWHFLDKIHESARRL